jgi:hypothetical protein
MQTSKKFIQSHKKNIKSKKHFRKNYNHSILEIWPQDNDSIYTTNTNLYHRNVDIPSPINDIIPESTKTSMVRESLPKTNPMESISQIDTPKENYSGEPILEIDLSSGKLTKHDTSELDSYQNRDETSDEVYFESEASNDISNILSIMNLASSDCVCCGKDLGFLLVHNSTVDIDSNGMPITFIDNDFISKLIYVCKNCRHPGHYGNSKIENSQISFECPNCKYWNMDIIMKNPKDKK